MSADEPVPAEATGRPGAGGCVLVGLAGVAVGVVFRVSQDAGVVLVWAAGFIGLYCVARRPVSDSSATPPPEGAGADSEDAAGQDSADSEGVDSREGMSIIPDPRTPGRWMVRIHHREETP